MSPAGHLTMEHDRARELSVEDLVSLTGEPVERLRRLCALGLIGSEGEDHFAPHDVERVRLIQFLERRQIKLEAIAQAEREEAILRSIVQFLYPDSLGRTYSFDQALGVVGLDPDVTRALRDISGAGDEPIYEHDLQMLRAAKVALDAGFPQTELLQLTRVYADALARVAEAEVRLFHFYVHEGFKAAGLSGADLRERRAAVRDHLLPIVGPMIRHFHRRGMVKAVREDMVLHLTGGQAPPAEAGSRAQLRLAIVFLDMSSYTPLTEVMGDTVAAKIVERFSVLVREATARADGRVVDRIGTRSHSPFRIRAPRWCAPLRSAAG